MVSDDGTYLGDDFETSELAKAFFFFFTVFGSFMINVGVRDGSGTLPPGKDSAAVRIIKLSYIYIYIYLVFWYV